MNDDISVQFSFVASYDDYEESATLLTLRLLEVLLGYRNKVCIKENLGSLKGSTYRVLG